MSISKEPAFHPLPLHIHLAVEAYLVRRKRSLKNEK